MMKLIAMYVLISLWVVPLLAGEQRHQNERIESDESKLKSLNEINAFSFYKSLASVNANSTPPFFWGFK